MKIDSYMPVRVFSGKNCLIEHSAELVKLGKRCLIVTGKHSAKLSGALDAVTDIFKSNNIDYCVFDKIEPNPFTKTCHAAGEAAREFECDYVLGIGGGSVLDASKAIAIFALNPDLGHADIYSRNIPSKHLPVVLIGTTAGTGSEVTGVSVLTNSDTNLKKSISGTDCYADISFCDSLYTKSVSRETRISACLDALAHAVEAYCASSSNELVEAYSEKAVRLLSPYITKSDFDNLSDDDIESLYMASLFAGLAINIAGTCFPHTVGYYLTENHNIPHGRACAAFFDVLIERTKKYCPEKFEAISQLINYDIELFTLCVTKLADVKISATEDEIKNVALRWKNGVKNFDRSPGGFSYDDAERALFSLIF